MNHYHNKTPKTNHHKEHMKTSQQDQALRYFNEISEEWYRKANAPTKKEVNIIDQRNKYVLRVAKERENVGLVLDVGCGSGELVCRLGEAGVSATGVDFAEEMIAIADRSADEMKLQNVNFICVSIFDFPPVPDKYDVISANGFIEYISYKELEKFFDFCHISLKSGGSLVVGSRNRIFNAFSLNDFTFDEIHENTIIPLLIEAIKLVNLDTIEELIGVTSLSWQKEDTHHHMTEINVHSRYQFTPSQLITRLSDKGFHPVEVYPIHIHGVLPHFKHKHPEVHKSISDLLQNYSSLGNDLVPFSSSFMLHVTKR